MNWHFLTFGGGSFPYRRAARRLGKEAKFSKLFQNVFAENDKTLAHLFPVEWSEILDFAKENQRGFGYWAWKPWIIDKYLSLIPEGEGLLYLDAGCVFNLNNQNAFSKMKEYFDIAELNGSLVTSLPDDGFNENIWTRLSVLEELAISSSDRSSGQRQATIIFLIANHKNKELIREWKKLSFLDNHRLLLDSQVHESIQESFVEHRHDQSIFSLTCKKYEVFSIPDESYWDGRWDTDGLDFPIWAKRNRNGLRPNKFDFDQIPDIAYLILNKFQLNLQKKAKQTE